MSLLNKLLSLFQPKPPLQTQEAKTVRYRAGQAFCRSEIKRGTPLKKLWDLSQVGDERGPPNEFEEGMKDVLVYETDYVPPTT